MRYQTWILRIIIVIQFNVMVTFDIAIIMCRRSWDSVRRRNCVFSLRRRRFRHCDQLRKLCSLCRGIHLRPMRRALVGQCGRGVPCPSSAFLSVESAERDVDFGQSSLRLHDGWYDRNRSVDSDSVSDSVPVPVLFMSRIPMEAMKLLIW